MPSPRGTPLRLVNWRLVATVAVPVWFLAVGIVVWQVKAKAARRAAAIKPIPVVVEPASPAPAEPEPAPVPAEVPAPVEVAAVPPEVAPEPAAAAKPAPKEEVDFAAAVAKAAEMPAAEVPVPPELAAAVKVPVPGEKPACVACDKGNGDGPAAETYGTKVRFAKHTVAAMQSAVVQDKLMLVLHISGNLEDPGFT